MRYPRAEGSGIPAVHCHTAVGKRAVDLLSYTEGVPLPIASLAMWQCRSVQEESYCPLVPSSVAVC